MHILAIVDYYASYRRAGSETFLHELLKALGSAGHRVSVLATAHNGTPQQVTFERVEVNKSAPDVVELRAFTRLMQPDLIITQHAEQRNAALVARDLNIPSVQIIHNASDAARQFHNTEHSLFVYCSLTAQHKFQRYNRPNCVINPVCWQAQHKPDELGDHITAVNMQKVKGVDTFRRVAASMPDRKFLGVQGGYGTQEFHAFKNIAYHPTTFDMKNDVWGRTRVFLFPSLMETWGMTGVEAMMAGIPVIAHPNPGVVESHRFAPIYVDRDDTDGWVDAIRSLDDSEVWREYSNRSLRQAGFLDPEPQLALWVELVEGLADAGRDGASAWWKSTRATRFGPILGIQGF